MKLKGNINHAVCRWCYDVLTLEELCATAKNLGITAIDLVGPEDWPVLQRYGLDSSMCNGAEISLEEGWNNKNNHALLISNYTAMIPLVAKAGYKNLICFSGNRNGINDETGLNICADGLRKVMAVAEKYKVTLVMELLNSLIDHPDYQCDHTAWGVALVKNIGSPNFKLLYDIYHMQVNEGNVIETINANSEFIGHYHTAGVPGRNEINGRQELNYPAIMRAIYQTGFKGYIAQEFIPSYANINLSLQEAISICDI